MRIFVADDIEDNQQKALLGVADEIGWVIAEEASMANHVVTNRATSNAITTESMIRLAIKSINNVDDQAVEEAEDDEDQHPSRDGIMAGWVVMVDDMSVPETDADLLLAGVLFFGGRISFDLRDPLLTHIVTLTDRRYDSLLADRQRAFGTYTSVIKMLRDAQLWRDPAVVLPHFFDDCFKLKRLLPTDDYAFPKPPILQLDYPAEPVHAPQVIKINVPPVTESPFLSGENILYFDPDYPMDKTILEAYKFSLSKAGVRWSDTYDPSNVIIVHFQDSPLFAKATSDGKRCGTIYWLLDILQTRSMTEPNAKLLCFPWPRLPISEMKHMCISISNYTQAAREMLKIMITRLGASYTPHLTQQHTHLICASPIGAKYEKAIEWSIPVINHTWLEDCWRNQKVMSVTEPGYTLLRGQLCRVVGKIGFDKESVANNIKKASEENVVDVLNSRELEISQTHCFTAVKNLSNKRKSTEVFSQYEQDVVKRQRLSMPMMRSFPSFSDSSSLSPSRKPRTLFTTIKFTQQELKVLKSLGIKEADSYEECTHLISEKVARTEKFLCALAFADFILSPDWIHACVKKLRHVPELPYILKDTNSQLEGRTIPEVLQQAKEQKLLSNRIIVATASVKPPLNILQRIVESHGGKFIPHEYITKRRLKGCQNVIVISSSDDQDDWPMYKAEGKHIYDSELIITSVLRQQLDLDEKFRLDSSEKEDLKQNTEHPSK